jgi:hypothetical protein
MIDDEELSLISDRVERGMNKILSSDDTTLDVTELSSVRLIGEMVESSLNEESSIVETNLVKVAKSYQSITKKIESSYKITNKIKLKKMIAKVYINTPITKVEDISTNLENDTTLENLDGVVGDIASKTSNDMPDVEEKLQDVVAGKVASSKVEDGAIPSEDELKGVVADNGLYESVKKVVQIEEEIRVKSKTTTLTQDDKEKLVATKSVMESIKTTVKAKLVVKISSTNSMFEAIKTSLSSARSDIEEYKNRILALQLSLENLSKDFDNAKFNNNVAKTVTVIKKIKVVEKVSIVKTITKIKIVIKEKFISNPNSDTTIDEVDNDIDNQIVIPDPVIREIILPQPRLESLPTAKIRFVI